jgi:hypothetical protein
MTTVITQYQNIRATQKQIDYLNRLRIAIGLPRWNAAKALLGINVPGTQTLSRSDASRLIEIINFVIVDERGMANE